MASEWTEELVAICDDCGKRIVDVLDWVVIESVELCAACYANTTRRKAVDTTEPGSAPDRPGSRQRRHGAWG